MITDNIQLYVSTLKKTIQKNTADKYNISTKYNFILAIP
jgi:hypothetical protein